MDHVASAVRGPPCDEKKGWHPMSTRAVHWYEGMFLRPHHFQSAYRHVLALEQESEKWDLHFNWGLRAIDLDREALANYRFVVRSVKVRLRDGTLVAL